MKSFLTLMMAAALIAIPSSAQVTVRLTAVPPPAVALLGAGVVGTPGNTSACYWVVTNYVGGGVLSSRATCLSNIPNTLSGSNYVQLTWPAMAGAVTYDVLKTTTSAGPVPGAATRLRLGLTSPTTTDQGGSLVAYTQTAFPFSNASTVLTLNNRDFAVPTLQVQVPMSVVPSGSGGGGNIFNISQLNDANGRNWLKATATANAVNGLVLTNGATGTGPTLAPGGTGSDSSIDQFVLPKGTGLVKIGNATTPFSVDSTGAALNQVYSVESTVTIANVNSGTTLVAAVTGRTLNVVHAQLQAIGGAVGTCTAVVIQDTNSSPVAVLTAAIAGLTQNTVVSEYTPTTVTLGTFGAALTADKGIAISKTGGTCDTATSVKVIVFYTINSAVV